MSAWHHRAIVTMGLRPLAYHLAAVYYSLRFRFASLTVVENPVLVYQMGKVGSSSLAATVRNLVSQNSGVYHVHHLTDKGLDEMRSRSVVAGRAYPGPGYWQGKYVKWQMTQQPKHRWRVITLTRDPVARNLSAFFQSLSLWAPNAIERFAAGEREILFEQLLQIFLRDYPHQKPHMWFERELEAVFGVDIYDFEFDQSSGYNIYDWGNVSLLVMRLENLSRCYRPALAVFFDKDTSDLVLVRMNEAAQKEYHLCYRAFLDWLILPEDYLQEQYSSRYAQHFYSEEERKRFSRKWQKRGL